MGVIMTQMTIDDLLQAQRLPDLPGMAPGIIGQRNGPRGTVYTLQCERCFDTEEPEILVLMTFHFHHRSQGADNPRLCRPCRMEAHPDCTCDNCKSDRGWSIYAK